MKRTAKSPPPQGARLFDESLPAPPAGVHIANIDGASRGNPGPAAYAVVLRAPNGSIVHELGKSIGRETNNVAEYFALIAALDYAASHGIRALRIRSDSELLVRQMQGRYKVKSPELKPLHERAQKLARGLDYVAIEHVRREANREADALANLALDRGGNIHGSPNVEHQSHGQLERMPERKIHARARFHDGMLIPDEPLDLPEGASIELEICISKKT
jgi:ribonuclease HI